MRVISKLVIAAALVGTAAAAQAQAFKPEELLKMRQGTMQMVKLQFGALGAFAGDKGPLPADAAARADNLVALARLAPLGWGKGSEALAGANTKPEAFAAGAEKFQAGWKTLGVEAEKLAVAAKGGNADAIKAQAGAVGKACKACHDDFRKE